MRSNVPIVLSRRSAYRSCRVPGLAIDIVLGLMRLFEHLRSKNAGPHTLSTTAKLQPLRPPVSWASAHYRFRRCHHKAGAWKMHANLADLAITASDHDLMDVRGDQFTDNRIASSIVRRDGNGLARFSTVGILGIESPCRSMWHPLRHQACCAL